MEIDYSWILILSAIMAYGGTSIIYRKVLKVAKIRRLTDNPNERKLQKSPVPVLGGLAVFFGMICGLLLAGSLFVQCTDIKSLVGGRLFVSTIFDLFPVMMACSILLFIGMVDDLIGLSPLFRLIVECLAILLMCLCSGLCVDNMYGLFGVESFSWWIGIPLTVFAGVGIINAYNMVDGVDGLSTGLCITTAPVLMAIFMKRQDWADASLLACFTASLFPFLLHNVFGKKSRMFIGDAGTMVMGALFTWCLIQCLSSRGMMSNLSETDPDVVMCLPVMMFSVASVPVLDTLRVMAVRKMQGKSVFQGDRNHLHHKFVDAGISPAVTSCSEILLNALVILAWYVSYKSGLWQMGQLVVTLSVAVVLVWGTYFFLDRRENYNSYILNLMRRFSVLSHIERRKTWKRVQWFVDRGSYEDMTEFVMRLMDSDGDLNGMDMDVISVMNYLQDSNKTKVSALVKNLKIDVVRVQNILKELDRKELVEVLERNDAGEIEKVKMGRLSE